MMLKAYRIPSLVWRLPLGASRPPESIVAHSYSLFEIVLQSREGIEAVGVDVHRGIVWREPVTSGWYIGRGLRIEGKGIVDTAGQTLLKLGIEPRRVVHGRRLVAVGNGRRIRLVDRALLEEIGDVDERKARIAIDEYTLLVYGKARRGYLLAVDSVFGFNVQRLRRNVRSVSVARGCFSLCDGTGCIVGNGSVEASTTVDTIPLSAVKGGCLVALAAETGTIIAMLEGDGSLEVIDSCSETPRVTYSDGTLVAYSCGDSTRVVKAGSPIPEYIQSKDVIVTPTYHARLEESHLKLLSIEYGEDISILIPVEHYMVVHRDAIMVLSGGWLYSLSLDNPTVMNVELRDDDRCPMLIKLVVDGYKVLGFDVKGEHIEPMDSVAGGDRVCLEILKLQGAYEVSLVAKFAPPLIAEANLTLPPVKPRLKVYAVEAPEADSITLLSSSGNHLSVSVSRALLVEIPSAWLKPLDGLRLRLYEGDMVTYETILGDRSVILAPLKLRGEPRVVIEGRNVRVSYKPRGTLRLLTPDTEKISVNDVLPFDTRRAAVTVKGTDPDMLLVDSVRCTPKGRGAWRCVVDVWRGMHELCTCRRYANFEDTMLCSCKRAPLSNFILASYADISDIYTGNVVYIDSMSPLLELYLDVAKEGLVPLEVEVGDEKVAKVVSVRGGRTSLQVPMPRLQEGIYVAELRVASRRGIVHKKMIAVYAKHPNIIIAKTADKSVVCSSVDLGITIGSSIQRLRPGECLVADKTPEIIASLDECGYLVEAKAMEINVVDALAKAVKIAERLARVTRVKL